MREGERQSEKKQSKKGGRDKEKKVRGRGTEGER